MSSFAEQQTEWIINNILVNGGWIIDNKPEKNVYFQKARPEHQHLLESFSKKKGYKKPDYILYQEDKLAGIIEAKRGGEPLDKALKQATEYAEMLKAPLVFASNGAYVETYHLTKDKPLFINGEKVDRLIKYKEAVEFIKSDKNEIYTFPIEFIKSKEDLIRIFKKVNNLLRKANIFAGYDRISEFSSILFLKLISEQEGEKSYWNSIKKQDDDFLLSYLNGTVIKALEDKYNGGVFSEINLKKASVMRQIINIVDPLVLSDIKTDIKGDAFEYFLKNMNQADNDLGQYFTPRHIVKAMVHLIDPKFKETIYDPFCGTGGFLIEAFNHIKENSIIKTEKDRKILRENTLFGRDATKVSTIAKKNMILHGDGHSNIEEKDSLEHPIEKKMSVILTNIPFSLKDVDYTDKYYHGLGKKNGDAICVLHCLDALEEGGRMALVVPEGFLFKKELKEIRKFLLSRANLELIISLPQGVFLPYTGVKTDILYFTNAHKPEVREGYYYFEVKKDGFTLDAHRRKIDGVNDIHKLEATNIRKGEKELLKEQGFEFIDFEKVRANNYNLVGSVYRITNITSKYQVLPLEEVCLEIKNGIAVKQNKFKGNYKVSRIESIANGVFNINKTQYTDDLPSDNDFLEFGDILFSHINSFDHLAKTAMYLGNDKSVIHGINLIKLKPNKCMINPTYLSYILKSNKFVNTAQKLGQRAVNQASIRVSELRKLSIPVPSLDKQQEIINELDSYQKIVDGAKQIVSNYKPYFRVGKNWDIVKLKDVILDIKDGGTPPRKNNNSDIYFNGNIGWCVVKDIKPEIYDTNEKLTEIGLQNCSSKIWPIDSIIISLGATIGKVGIAKIPVATKQGLSGMVVDKIKILPQYLFYVLQEKKIEIQNMASGATIKEVRPCKLVEQLHFFLPPLHMQQEIVEQLEQERKMIDSQKEIIKLFEAKIQNRLNSLWQSEEENESVADKAIFDTLIKQASKPLES
jgi:type I restriction enzyme M protein